MSQLTAGMARYDITAWEPDMQLWGWFMPYNRAEGVATPLYARALVLKNGDQALAYVCADLGFISVALRRIVTTILAQEHPSLGLGAQNVMLTATHTHSGPTGFSDVIGQNSVNYGFSPTVLAKVVEGIVEAILAADARRVAAEIRVGEVDIPKTERVAFNRSCHAYNRNPDVEQIDPARPVDGTRRRSTTLRVDGLQGGPIGCINWFGVHCTSIHAENALLHSDNKGIAAQLLETEMRHKGAPAFVAIFAQEAAGDVSPNFRYDPKRNKVIGVYQDDDASARYNGGIQARYASQAWSNAAGARPLDTDGDAGGPGLGGLVQHVDMAGVRISADWTKSEREQFTTPATWGMLMPAGTAEGPGPLRPFLPLLRAWMHLRRGRTRQSNDRLDTKFPFLELGLGAQGRFLGVMPTHRGLGPVGLLDPNIGYIHALRGAGLLGNEPWLPQVVPIQLLRIGSFGIVGLPAEITTVAGMRLRKTIQDTWHTSAAPESAQGGHEGHLVINGYANGYNGYITTPEEYEQQEYEGSYTTFGKWTLPAYQMFFQGLAQQELPTDPWASIAGPTPPTNTYDTLLQRRKIGRKGAWGRNTDKQVPVPTSRYLPLIQKALAPPPHHFRPEEMQRD